MRWRDNGWSIDLENIWAYDAKARVCDRGDVFKPTPLMWYVNGYPFTSTASVFCKEMTFPIKDALIFYK